MGNIRFWHLSEMVLIFVKIRSSTFDTFSNPLTFFSYLLYMYTLLSFHVIIKCFFYINQRKTTNIQFLTLYLNKSLTWGDSILSHISINIVDGFSVMHYGPFLACNYLCDVHNNCEAYNQNNMFHECDFISH